MTFSLSDASQWFDFIGKFDAAMTSFLSNYNSFINLQNIPPQLEDEYNSLLSQANDDYSTMVQLQQLKSDAESFFSDYGQQIMDNPNILGLMGLHKRKGLGFWPVIAGIGAAAAAVYLYEILHRNDDRDAFRAKLEYAQTHTVAEANQLFGSSGGSFGSSFAGSISSALMPFAIIAALIFLGPPVLKMLEGKRG